MRKIRIKAWIIHQLLRLIFWFGGVAILEPYIYFRKIRLKINEIEDWKTWFQRDKCIGKGKYDWDLLIEDIKRDGIKNPPIIYYAYDATNNKQFYVVDGKHRFTALRELYGDDHVVTCSLYVPDPFDSHGKYMRKNKYGGEETKEALNLLTYKIKKIFNER